MSGRGRSSATTIRVAWYPSTMSLSLADDDDDDDDESPFQYLLLGPTDREFCTTGIIKAGG